MRVDGLSCLAGLPQRDAPVASSGDELRARWVKREMRDSLRVAGELERGRALRALTAEIPHDDFIAGGRAEKAAVRAPLGERDLRAVAAHLRVFACRQHPEVHRAILRAAHEDATVRAV